jgi:hypothetical protein
MSASVKKSVRSRRHPARLFDRAINPSTITPQIANPDAHNMSKLTAALSARFLHVSVDPWI